MSPIERFAGNTPWEPIFGYSRAVRAGDWLVLSGTTAVDERGLVVGAGQMYVQTRQALLNIKTHIERAGLTIANVVRTRVFTTDISRYSEIARAHKEILGDMPPASTLVEVRRLIHPEMLVEIEADVWSNLGAPKTGTKLSRTAHKPKAKKPAHSKTGAATEKRSRARTIRR